MLAVCRSGLGSYVQWDKLDAKVLRGVRVLSNAFKGVEFGMENDRPSQRAVKVWMKSSGLRKMASSQDNNLGGFEGGMTNGQPIVVQCHEALFQPFTSH